MKTVPEYIESNLSNTNRIDEKYTKRTLSSLETKIQSLEKKITNTDDIRDQLIILAKMLSLTAQITVNLQKHR